MQIVVLGMHRSGTSALCGLLNLAGVYFGRGDEFIPANEENPKGFWERKDVRRLNDDMLHALASDWSEISHLEREKLSSEVLDSFQIRGKSILDNLQEDAPADVSGLKEPRFCLLMDFWASVLSSEVFYILLHRDTEEIAISLKTRNNIPAEVANYLTEQYLGKAICALQTRNCHITCFENLISDPASELEAIISALEKATGVSLQRPTRKEIESSISPRLYRSKSKGEPFAVSAQLQSWNEELSRASLPELKSFQQSVPNGVLPYEHSKRFSEFIILDKRFRRLEGDYFVIKEKLADKHKLVQIALQREAQVTELEQAALQRKAQVAELEQDAALRRKAQVVELEQDALQHKAQVADLEQDALQREAQVAELEQDVLQREAQVADLEQDALQREAQVTKLGHAARQRDARIAKLQTELISLEAKARDISNLSNQVLDRLNTLQGSATTQLSRPLFLAEGKFPGIVHGIAMVPKLLWWTMTFQLRKNWRLHRQAIMLLETGLFDLPWYIHNNPDVVLEGVDPVWHWLTLGWRKGRDPNPLFRNNWYLEHNLDVADAGDNPLLHYLSHGSAEGQDPHPLFNNDWYLALNPDVADAGINPLAHYLSYGASEGRHTMPSSKQREPIRRFDVFDEGLERKTRAGLRERYKASDKAKAQVVSIIMPTYNRAGMITAAIESVVAQTHKNWELFIVDDGSGDDTEAVVNTFRADARIKYLKKDRGGVCRARNAGLDLAQGERIAFLDSDNSWDREFLALLVAAIETSKVEIAYCGLRMQQKGRTVGYRGDVFNYDECLKSNYVDLNALMFKAPVIGTARFDESIRRMNDWDFLLLVALNRKVEYFPFVGVSYSFHERADQISELEPQIYKKLIQERHKNQQAKGWLMTTREAFTRLHLDIAILLAAPKDKRNEWGDYHYATGLAEALERRGHRLRLYYHQERVEGAPPDVTISLRGLTGHEFMVGTIKTIWSISHPDLLTWQQIDECDLLFCASLTWPQMLRWAGKTNVFTLLQCTDHARFSPKSEVGEPDGRVLFVGNSRKVDRPIVRHAIEAGVNLHIYGTNWAERVPKALLKGEYIPNEQLGEEYAAASVVLNDHWPSMRDFGYISNRIFDVTAAGGALVSDHLPGIQRVFGNAVGTYQLAEDFSSVVNQSIALSGSIDRAALGTWVNENHTFQNRADDILSRVEEFALAKKGQVTATDHGKSAVALRGNVSNLRVGLIPQRSGASMTSSAFIRVVQPLTSELDDLTVDLKRVDQQETLDELDAIIVSRTAFDSLELAEAFLERSARHGIPVVVDVDDSFHLMDESHPQFAEYRPKIDALSLMLESADEIWCSTVPLQDSLQTRFGPSILFPNSLDPRLWRSYRDFTDLPPREDDGCLELLYAGSVTHGSDLEMIMPVLDQLQKNVPIRLTVIGIAPDISSRTWIRRLTPGTNSVYPRFAPWMRRQAGLFDVGIAPLAENDFNRFKSDLKILEYRAMGLVPVASASQPYLDSEAIDNQVLCSDPEAWLDSLMALATDPEKLARLKESVKASNSYIWEDRSAVSTGEQIVRRLCNLVNQNHQ